MYIRTVYALISSKYFKVHNFICMKPNWQILTETVNTDSKFL